MEIPTCQQLSETFSEFVTEREQEELAAILQQTEFWLYEEGEDESKSVYVAKLAELKKVCHPKFLYHTHISFTDFSASSTQGTFLRPHWHVVFDLRNHMSLGF